MRPLIVSLVLLLLSCKQNTCLPPSIYIAESVTIFAGDTLRLEPQSVSGAAYKWVGPGNFTSSQKDVVIIKTPKSAQGEYTVNVKSGGCEKNAVVSVVVLDTPQCNISNNTLLFPSAMYMPNSRCGIGAPGQFNVNHSGLQGDFLITFFTDPVKKGSFIYNVSTLNTEASDVYLQLSDGGVWQGMSGKLFVRIINNRLTASFCDVPFGNLNTSITQKGSGQFSCQ